MRDSSGQSSSVHALRAALAEISDGSMGLPLEEPRKEWTVDCPLARLRRQAALSLAKASARLGLEQRQQWHNWEQGKPMSVATLVRIADEFRVNRKHLVQQYFGWLVDGVDQGFAKLSNSG